MKIDGKAFGGRCACGKEHEMTTEFCVIESGCMTHFDEYRTAYGLCGVGVAIYDENTYHAKGLKRPRAEHEIILSPKDLHADEKGTEAVLSALPASCDYLIAVGAGTVHDITRYCAYERGIPFISCPTAASVDGFCSSVAAMTWHGYKKTFTAVSPRIVIADLDVIVQAPAFLARSGFGDMIGKFIALADWKIAHTLTGEYFCPRIYGLTKDATDAIVASAAELKNGSAEAYEKLMYGLLMSGLAMQLLGNSRCASGAEHHISHLIEMKPRKLALYSDALHGEKVGVGTLLACRTYHKIKNDKNIAWQNYKSATDAEIESVFGDDLSDAIRQENEKDACMGITAERITECWEKICGIIDEIPQEETLLALYEMLSVRKTLSDIGVAEEKTEALLKYSPLVRNRLTLMRLLRALT